MAFSEQDLQKNESAIASTSLETQFEGRRLRRRSMPELLQANAHMKAANQAAEAVTAGRKRGRIVRVMSTKGL